MVSLLVHYVELSSISDQTESIGLSGIEGMIAAYGDFNSDQATDVFVINNDCKMCLYLYFFLKALPYRQFVETGLLLIIF